MTRRRPAPAGDVIKTADAERFELLNDLLHSLQDEVREISKKKPDGVLNKSKVGRINRILRDVKALLTGQPSVEYLDVLSDDELPQYSDAVLLLGHYAVAMKRFSERYHHRSPETRQWEWNIGDE